MTTDASSVFMFDTNWFQKVFRCSRYASLNTFYSKHLLTSQWFSTPKSCQRKCKAKLRTSHNVWKLLKMSHLNFSTLAFSTYFYQLKVAFLVTLFDHKHQVFKYYALAHIFWKSPKMSHLNFSTLAIFTNFCLFKIELSGNTIWLFVFKSLLDWPFLAFLINFCPLKM